MTTDSKTTRTWRVRWRDTPQSSFRHADYTTPKAALNRAQVLQAGGADGVKPYEINERGDCIGFFDSWGCAMEAAQKAGAR